MKLSIGHPRAIVVLALCFFGFVLTVIPDVAFAMPWDGPLKNFRDNISGPTVAAIATIVFAVIGVLIAIGENRGIMGTVLRVGFGLSFALMAASWVAIFQGGSM